MKDLTADPDYIRGLARTQRQAATDTARAAALTDGVTRSLWLTHGPSVFLGNIAFSNAADARRAAGDAMEKLSDSIADRLENGATIYVNVDQQQGRDFDNRIPD